MLIKFFCGKKCEILRFHFDILCGGAEQEIMRLKFCVKNIKLLDIGKEMDKAHI